MNKKHFYFQNKIPNKYLVFLTMVILLLINEFTLSFFDKNPPLANNTIWNIRKFNLFCIFFNVFAYGSQDGLR